MTKLMALCVPACVVSTSLPGRTATLKSSLPCLAFYSTRIVLRMMDFVVAMRACVFVLHSLTVGIAEDLLYKSTLSVARLSVGLVVIFLPRSLPSLTKLLDLCTDICCKESRDPALPGQLERN